MVKRFSSKIRSDKKSLVITIITVSYNSEKYIEDAIKSVLAQKNVDLEYLIIDGKSTDKTMAIIQNFKNKIKKIVCEPDRGIYYAMNKGLGLATGDIIGFLNSDDVYNGDHVLQTVMKAFQDKKVDACYGDLIYFKPYNMDKISRYWKSSNFIPKSFSKGWMPPHPTFFVRKNIYEKLGFFNTRYSIAADFDLMLRFLQVGNINSIYIPDILVKMRLGGVSNRSFRNIFRQNREVYNSLKTNGQPIYWYNLFIKKFFKKASQYLRKP